MRVALGTVEIDEDRKRRVGKAIKNSVRINRDEMRAFLLAAVDKAIEDAINPAVAAVESTEPAQPFDDDELAGNDNVIAGEVV